MTDADPHSTSNGRNAPYTPPEGPPQLKPDPAIYEKMGRENIYAMAEALYRRLESSWVRPLFPEDMPTASQKMGAFLVGILGGPSEYRQQYGPPKMRARHLPFPIGPDVRDEWLGCFYEVLEDAPEQFHFPPEHLQEFKDWLAAMSRWMINHAEPTGHRVNDFGPSSSSSE